MLNEFTVITPKGIEAFENFVNIFFPHFSYDGQSPDCITNIVCITSHISYILIAAKLVWFLPCSLSRSQMLLLEASSCSSSFSVYFLCVNVNGVREENITIRSFRNCYTCTFSWHRHCEQAGLAWHKHVLSFLQTHSNCLTWCAGERRNYNIYMFWHNNPLSVLLFGHAVRYPDINLEIYLDFTIQA